MKVFKPKVISLRNHASLDERWVQEQIADDPSILGLGDLNLKDIERSQPRAGRLDLLLQDPDTRRRYEVEVQLGKTDESHIIRTIEYWDIERKRYPQYDHCAVIVAEDVTSRFLNVIGLFNGFIPLIALQMTAFEVGDKIGLMFTKIVDDLNLGFVEEEEEARDVVDRAYWEEKRGTRATVAMADKLLELMGSFAPDLEFKYNRHYVGLAQGGKTNNFVLIRPRKKLLNLEVRIVDCEEVQSELDAADLDVMDYDTRSGRYRIRLTRNDIKKHGELLTNLMQTAYEACTA